jgi:hypothetical protein
MKTGKTKVIAQREQGSMSGGCWQEFLVLEKLGDTEFLLDVRGWDYLGEVGVGEFDFKKDKYDEIIVPEEINGKFIRNVEDGFVYGGELVKSGGEQGEVKFTRPEQDEVIRWLKDVMWHDEDVIKTLAEECTPYSTQG